MTLQEAIEHLEEKLAEDNWSCKECKKEHEQLLEWLIELKNWREADSLYCYNCPVAEKTFVTDEGWGSWTDGFYCPYDKYFHEYDEKCGIGVNG